MKHSDLRKVWEERFESVKSPMPRKDFFTEIESVVKEAGGELSAYDLAVISEIHKDATDYRLLDEDKRELIKGDRHEINETRNIQVIKAGK